MNNRTRLLIFTGAENLQDIIWNGRIGFKFENINEKLFNKACCIAEISNLIQEEGVFLKIGHTYNNLSEGQMQRICIARAFYKFLY